jgi:hypothetical protein
MMDIQYSSIPSDQAEALVDVTVRHLRRMLFFRRLHDERRIRFFRQYVGNRDQQYFPDNVTKRSNVFMPYPYSNVETVVSRTMDALFSYEPWFECQGRGEQDELPAEQMQIVLQTKLHRARVQDAIESLIRNHDAIKVDWDFGYDLVTVPEPVFVQTPVKHPETGAPVTDENGNHVMGQVHDATGSPMISHYEPKKIPVPRNRPRISVIDVYDLLVDPDGGLNAHVIERTYGEMMRENEGYLQKTGNYLYYPEALQAIGMRIASDKDPNSVLIRFAEYWNEPEGTCTSITFGDDIDALRWKDLRESYRSGTAYSPFKRQVYVGPPILLWHGENQFSHKRSPIRHTSYVKQSHTPYGIGVIESTAELSEALNSSVNMIRDNWNLGINRRYLYNTDMDIDHTALNDANVPGGKVGVSGDVNQAVKELPTHTPQAGDYGILDLFKSSIEATSGISDFYSRGVGAPTGNSTATGISSIINEGNYRFRLFIRNLELDILQPLLEMCASNVQQFITDQEEVLMTQQPVGIPKWQQVDPSKLIGSFDFNLVAANYATSETVRQRNILAFANLVGQSPYINEFEAIRAMGKIFKIRNIDQILKPPQQVAMEQQAAHQQQLKEEVDLMMLQAALGTEEKVAVAKAKGTATGGKEGRPRSSQFEGKIPGVGGDSSAVRDIAQNLLGGNAMGLEGLGNEGGQQPQ